MKKVFSETIDGSMKDILQLKTLDNSLEYSQMYDALEDTPRDFQTKLIDALNSLAKTMGVPATETFNKVLCKSDEDEDVRKKLYNWWRSVFEILSKCKIPQERMDEFNEKVDDLMAEILKAGDGEATAEEQPEQVMESGEYDFAQFAADVNSRFEKKVLAKVNSDNTLVTLEVWPNERKEIEALLQDVCAEHGWKFEKITRRLHYTYYLKKGEPVTEDYENASMKDENKMLENMQFAIQHIGEIANKVQDLINFINPYCGNSVNEGHMTKPGRYGIGDHVLYKGEECVVIDVDEDLRNDEEIYQVSRDSDKVAGLSFNSWATWDELDPVEGFTEEVKSTMKFKKKIDERIGGGYSDEWVSMNDYIGEEFGEASAEPLEATKFIEAMMEDDDSFGGEISFVDGEQESNGEVKILFTTHDRQFRSQPDKKIMDMVDAEAKKFGWALANFGWKDNHKDFTANFYVLTSVNEAKVTVDVNDVWDVLELLDDENANKNLTDLINSHVRTEEEIMDAIDTCYPENIRKGELNAYMNDSFDEIVSELGLDVERFKETGEFVDSGKPTYVELESDQKFNVGDEITWRHHNGSLSNEVVRELTDGGYIVDDGFAGEKECYPGHVPEELLGKPNMEWDGKEWKQGIGMAEGTDLKDVTEKLTAEELADSIEGWEDRSKKMVVCDAYASGTEVVNVNVLTLTDKREEVMKMANDYLLGNVENWQVRDASEPRKDENGQFYTELILEPKYEEVSENNNEVKAGDVKDGEKQVTQDGETKTLVAGEEKKPVCEMTIEQEIDDPWKLSEMLWSQGKENLQELLRSELVGEEDIMMMLEDMEIHNLTSINDAFAFDFPSILDSLGLDAEAWSQNLEFKRKGED